MATTIDTIIEGRVKDLSTHATHSCGALYSSQMVQVFKKKVNTDEPELQHAFYQIDEADVISKLGAISFTGDSFSFDVVNNAGDTVPIFTVGEGGIEILEGIASFGSTSLNVEDIDIILGSNKTSVADLNGGGIYLGLLNDEDTGDPILLDGNPISILYDQPNNFWTSSVGINLDTGNAFTVGVDAVSLSETGLTVGTVDPIVLDNTGLSVGSDLSITKSAGLSITDTVGTNDISLTTAGLTIGTEVAVTPSAVTLGSVDPIILNADGLTVGPDLSLTLTNGLQIGDDFSLDSSGLFIGTAPDQTIVDDTSVQLGTDLLMNHDGLYIKNNDGAIFMGDLNQWKIIFDSSTNNLKFQYDDSGTGANYVTKTEIKST